MPVANPRSAHRVGAQVVPRAAGWQGGAGGPREHGESTRPAIPWRAAGAARRRTPSDRPRLSEAPERVQPLVWGYSRPGGAPMIELRARLPAVEVESYVVLFHTTLPSASIRAVSWCPLYVVLDAERQADGGVSAALTSHRALMRSLPPADVGCGPVAPSGSSARAAGLGGRYVMRRVKAGATGVTQQPLRATRGP